MTTYKGINGFAVQSVASDPSPLDEGQVWYNNATYAFKLAGLNTAAWASGGNMGTARTALAESTNGTQTANIVFGGDSGSPTGATESYNGTSWSPAPSMNTARSYLGGAGTQTASVSFGGKDPGTTGATEKWNGSTWTNNPTGLNVARHYLCGCGTQTTALAIGGNPANPPTSAVESFNGSTWTNLTNTPTANRSLAAAFGVSTAAVVVSNTSPPAQSWNGSTWTNLPNMNTARSGLAAAGTQTAGLAFGGIPNRNLTELWDGTAWSTQPTMATGRHYLGGCGTQTSALAAGGYNATGNSAATEEWTGAGVATKTITTS